MVTENLEKELVDSKSHPKFPIGESAIPDMLTTLCIMALRYEVSEILALSTFTGCQKIISAASGRLILNRLNFTVKQFVRTLAGGQRTRVSLACVMVSCHGCLSSTSPPWGKIR